MKRIILGTTLFVILLLGVICSTSTNTTTHDTIEDKNCYISENVVPIKDCAITKECIMTDDKKFQIKEYEGNIAVFKYGTPVPIKITSTTIEDLPDVDKQLLKNGVEASSEEEINILLEDYCS